MTVKLADSRKDRRQRGARGKRASILSICKAILEYPRSAGASVRNIHNLINKKEKARNRKSVSSVRVAITRGIEMGKIRPPQGWKGFRGMQYVKSRSMSRGPKLRGRRGRRPLVRSQTRGRSRRSMVRTAGRRTPRGKRALRRVPPGKTCKHRRARRHNRRDRRQHRRSRSANRNASSCANDNENFTNEEPEESQLSSLWQGYTCTIS